MLYSVSVLISMSYTVASHSVYSNTFRKSAGTISLEIPPTTALNCEYATDKKYFLFKHTVNKEHFKRDIQEAVSSCDLGLCSGYLMVQFPYFSLLEILPLVFHDTCGPAWITLCCDNLFNPFYKQQKYNRPQVDSDAANGITCYAEIW